MIAVSKVLFFFGGGAEVAGSFHKKPVVLWWFQTFYMFTALGKILILTNVFQMGGSTTNQNRLVWNEMGKMMVLWTHLEEFVGANDFLLKFFGLIFG